MSADTLAVRRIVDANANRAGEALRVIEDYARFGLDSRHWTGVAKRLRHELADAVQTIGAQDLLESRDTRLDVGTELTVPTEQTRADLHQVLVAAFKRLQEALRTLEEYSKLLEPRVAPKLEALRYETYTFEKSLALIRGARLALQPARLYVLVTEALAKGRKALDVAAAAIRGGADVVQLREKERPDRELLVLARQLRELTASAGTLFIVNDRCDIARLTNADGVHLGQDDLPVPEARKLVGREFIIGVSTHSVEQAEKAEAEGADYVGVGPTFPTRTKPGVEAVGLDYVREAARTLKLPAFAIGGIDLTNVAEVVAAGAARVAVCSAIIGADDVEGAARKLKEALQTGPRE